MILTCPSCNTRYRADPASFKPSGRNVRCAKCSHTWFQPAPEPEAPAPLTIQGGDAVTPTSVPLGITTEREAPVGALSEARQRRAVGDRIGGKHILQVLAFVLLLGALAAAGWAVVHYRQTLVRLWPASARVYSLVGLPVNLTGIAITDVMMRQDTHEGAPVLSVTGNVVNVSDREQSIPRLAVVVLDDSKRELYRWSFDPGIPPLMPGASGAFDATLASPPPDATSVNVFVDSEDAR